MNQPLIDTDTDDLFNDFSNMKLNSNLMTQSNYLVDFGDQEASPVLNGNGAHLSPVNQALRDITAHANADVDLKYVIDLHDELYFNKSISDNLVKFLNPLRS